MESSDQLYANWAQIVSAGAVVVGAFFAFFTIHRGRVDSRASTTFRYLERQDETDFAHQLMAARQTWVLSSTETKADGIARYKALTYLQYAEIARVLNFYEEVSAVYNRNLFDKSVFQNMLGTTVLVYWREAHWLINYLRESPSGEVDPDTWDSWERAQKKLMKAHVGYQRTPDSDPA